MPNSIHIINPYWQAGTWVFDDPARDLMAEPFVNGAPEILSALVEQAGIAPATARAGFRLLFSPDPFPGHQQVARRGASQDGGTWYTVEPLGISGWLCPALFAYFAEAPRELYVKAEAL